MPKRSSGFTLVELLVVIAIIAVLAALLFPVFGAAKQATKRTTCVSNMHQIGMAAQLYLNDYDSVYPQTRQFSSQPDREDVSGGIDEPIYEPAFGPLQSYLGSHNGPDQVIVNPIFICPVDQDPFGRQCIALDPDAPDVTSYLANAYFVFGLNQSSLTAPSNTIYMTERRSDPGGEYEPFCDDIYHPWFNESNSAAPDNEMDARFGAVATLRHLGLASYAFADSHVKAMRWAETYAPPAKNLHLILQ